jgi:hypothetical protein
MNFLEKYRRSNGHRERRLFPRNPETGLPYSRDIALTPRNIWRMLKWLWYTDVVQILFQPFIIIYGVCKRMFKRGRRIDEYRHQELLRQRHEAITAWEHGNNDSRPKVEKPKYNMSPHKFD